MDHIAILRKAKISQGDNLLGSIIEGRKTIESRWYINKVSPWNKVTKGDTVYFKESGGSVKAKATVSKVLQFEKLDETAIRNIVEKYGSKIAPDANQEKWDLWIAKQSQKKYCILVFLVDVERVQPFSINKDGFGMSSAWLVVPDINNVKINFQNLK